MVWGLRVWGLGYRVWGLGFGVGGWGFKGLWFGVCGSVFGVRGLGLGVEGIVVCGLCLVWGLGDGEMSHKQKVNTAAGAVARREDDRHDRERRRDDRGPDVVSHLKNAFSARFGLRFLRITTKSRPPNVAFERENRIEGSG